jgi:hypothetical protein
VRTPTSVDDLANGVDPSIGVQTPVLTLQSKVSLQDIAKRQSPPLGIETSDLESFGTKPWGISNADLGIRLTVGLSQKDLFQFDRRKRSVAGELSQ